MKRHLPLLAITASLLSLAAHAAPLATDVPYALGIGGKAVFVPNAATNSNARVAMWTDTECAAQRWILGQTESDPSRYTLRNAYSGYYLSYNGTRVGAPVNQLSFSNFSSCWNLVADDSAPDTYILVSAQNPDVCLTAASTDDGAYLSLQDRADADASLTRFTLRQDDTPLAFGEAVRDDMMDGFLGQYYHPAQTGHVLGGGGWWGDAEMFEVILDAFATTGDPRYKEVFDELYTDFIRRNGTDWSGNEFNDDITWMVLACARAYRYFGTEDYLTKAVENYTRMYNRARQRFGTLIWKQSQENKIATNSCINCPATVAACYLGELTGDKTWYDKALSIYAGQRKLLFNEETGEVWDCGAWTEDGGRADGASHWVSTYNQGTMLGAATALYVYTGEQQYADDARKVYERARDHLTNRDKIISVCQTVNGDLCGFKGILMRYVRTYAETFHTEEPLQWLEKNAWHAWQNRNSAGVIWSAWLTKTAEDLRRTEGDDVKDVTNDAFGASTAVSAAFNAHVNRKFAKPASEGLLPEHFDDLSFMLLERGDDGRTVTSPSTRTKAYIVFRNVDFGAGGLDRVMLRLNATASRSFAQVYIDGLADANLAGRTAGFLKKEWADVPVDLETPLTGVHDVYVMFSGAGVQLAEVSFGTQAGVDAVAASAVSVKVDGSMVVVDTCEPAVLTVHSVFGLLERTLEVGVGRTLVELSKGLKIIRVVTPSAAETIKTVIL